MNTITPTRGKRVKPIHLLLVDDHRMFREVLRAILECQDDLTVVAEAGDAGSAVHLAKETKPDVILMDLGLPGESGIEATRRICRLEPASQIIIVTMFRDDSLIAAAIEAGASGYILKTTGADDLIQAIRTVAAGGAAIDPTVASRVLGQYRRLAGRTATIFDNEITARDLEILRLLAAGKSNQEIADSLHLSCQTVKNMLSEIYQKLDVTNRTQAVIVALRKRLIQEQELPMPDSSWRMIMPAVRY